MDNPLDVLVAGDGSCVVIQPNGFISSQGVSQTLTPRELSNFYKRHKQRQNIRAREI
jgi:hypothetical protein